MGPRSEAGPPAPGLTPCALNSADPKVQNARNAAVDTHTSVAHQRWRTYSPICCRIPTAPCIARERPRLADAGLPDGADRELVLRRRPSTSTSAPPAIRSSRRPPSGEFDANQLVQT